MRSTRSLLALIILVGGGLLTLTAVLLLSEGGEPSSAGDRASASPEPAADETGSERVSWSDDGPESTAVRKTVADPRTDLEARTKAARALIRGRVETEYGEPLGGILVELTKGLGFMGSRGRGAGSSGSALETQTQSDGQFRFEVPQETWGNLTARGAGYVPATIRGVSAGDDVVCVLEEGMRLSGVVLDAATGYPVAEAIVTAGRGWRGGSSGPVARTGGDGRFELTNLQAGVTSIQVVALGYEAGEFRDIAVGSRSSQPATFSLKPGRLLSGVVRDDESDTPLPGASVTYSLQGGREGMMARFGRGGGRGGMMGRIGSRLGRTPPGDDESIITQTVVTDSSGSFTFGRVGLHGATVRAEAEGYAAGSLWGRDLEKGTDPDTEASLVEIKLVPSVTLAGRVLDPDGGPVRNAEVSWSWRGAEPTTTDAHGRFEIAGLDPSDRVRLTARHPLFASGSTNSFSVREAPQPLEIKLQPPGRIHGVVLGPDQTPQAGVRVQMRIRFDRNMMRGGFDPTGMLRLAVTGEDGRFLFSGLSAGRWTLVARGKNSVGDPQEIELKAGEQREVNVSVIPASAITGMVLDSTGNPVAGARVYASERTEDGAAEFITRMLSGDFSRGMGSGGRGSFMHGRGPGGNTDSAGAPRGGRDQSAPSRDRGPSGRAGFMSRMRGRGGFGGRVGAFLDTRRATAFTDEQGRFVVSGFPADIAVTVTASRSGYAMGRAEAPAGAADVIVMLRELITLEGRVADAKTGMPIPSFSVEIRQVEPASGTSSPEAQARPVRRNQRITNPDGLFVLNRLVAGEYQIQARSAEHYPGEWATVRVMPHAPPGPQIVLRLKPAAVVKGTVLDERGRPAPRIPVFLSRVEEEPPSGKVGKTEETKGTAGGAGRNPSAQAAPRRRSQGRVKREQTGRDGVFTFKNLEPGDYVLGVGRASAPTVGPISVHLEEAGVASERMRLPPLGTVEVTVKDEQGRPAQHTMVRARMKGPDRVDFTGRTDEDGLARIENLLPGTYTLNAMGRGGSSKEKEFSVNGSGTQSRDLVLQPRQRRGGQARSPGGGDGRQRGGRGG